MTASRHTSHHGLSQFAETDRPTWFGDYNSDMAKIDTAIYNAADRRGTAVAPYQVWDDNDCDKALTPGFYELRADVVHGPVLSENMRGALIVARNTGSAIISQVGIVGNYYGVGGVYFRSSVNGGDSWSNWVKLNPSATVESLEQRVAALESKLATISSPTTGLTAKQYDEAYANNSNIIIAGQQQ